MLTKTIASGTGCFFRQLQKGHPPSCLHTYIYTKQKTNIVKSTIFHLIYVESNRLYFRHTVTLPAFVAFLTHILLETGVSDRRAEPTSLRAKIYVLPDEILSYIFEWGTLALDDDISKLMDIDEDGPDVPALPEFQVLVSHVSQRFRRVAINTRSLWTVIHALDLVPAQSNFIRRSLKRSGSLPFSICLNCSDMDLGDDRSRLDSDIDEALCLINPNIFRLERFAARFPFFALLHRVMTYLNQPAPQLKTLELYEAVYESIFDEEMPFSPYEFRQPLTLFKGEMPQLNHLLLDGVHVAWSECNFRNLVSLSLVYHPKDVRPTYEEFQAIIQNSPSLRDITLRGSAPLISEDASVSNLYKPLPLQALENLTIANISASYAPTFISLFRAPKLKSLVLSELYADYYCRLFDRIAGPPALFPSLVSLQLTSILAKNAAAARLLRAYPKLEWLGLIVPRDYPQWVKLLENGEADGSPNQSRPSEHLCPALKCLHCVNINLHDIKDVFMKREEAKLPLPRLVYDTDSIDTLFNNKSTLDWLKEHTEVKLVNGSVRDYDAMSARWNELRRMDTEESM